jgi:hypothetical protein
MVIRLAVFPQELLVRRCFSRLKALLSDSIGASFFPDVTGIRRAGAFSS